MNSIVVQIQSLCPIRDVFLCSFRFFFLFNFLFISSPLCLGRANFFLCSFCRPLLSLLTQQSLYLFIYI
ncbi:hypothetical protein CLU79DRAFT_821810 [Phycomyces nitens]|nr:hypothetical protein CLU79DRAFT_821810 [Phycomyces nitens]